MGCWNHTCMISRLHVLAGEEVVSLFLAENTRWNSLCYSTAFWSPVPVLIYGKYNDYGAVEDFSGKFDHVLLNHMKKHLIPLEQGSNPYHDHAVTPNDLDMEQLYEIDHECRLLYKPFQHMLADEVGQAWQAAEFPVTAHTSKHSDDVTYYAKDPCAHFKHVVIKKSLFDQILTTYSYVHSDWKDREKMTGYYTQKIFFKDIEAQLKKVLDIIDQAFDDAKEDKLKQDMLDMRLIGFSNGDPRGLLKYLGHDIQYYDKEYLVLDFLGQRSAEGDYYSPKLEVWEEALKMSKEDRYDFLLEFMKFRWLQMFMSDSRIHWTPATGAGGQSQESAPYVLLGQYMIDELAREKAEYDSEWGDEDETEE